MRLFSGSYRTPYLTSYCLGLCPASAAFCAIVLRFAVNVGLLLTVLLVSVG